MSSAARVHGGAALRNGRVLALYRGYEERGRPTRVGPSRHRDIPSPGRELGAFVAAVFIGSLGGLLAGRWLAGWLDAGSAGAVALAVGTTMTAAAHAGLVHGQTLLALLPRVVVAAPLAYVVMQGVHRLAGL